MILLEPIKQPPLIKKIRIKHMNAVMIQALINFSSDCSFLLILTQRNSVVYDMRKRKPLFSPFFIFRTVKVTLDPAGR
ncbi:hypothetical protein D3C78_1704560 [compost metagenome]